MGTDQMTIMHDSYHMIDDVVRKVHPLIEFAAAHAGAENREAFGDAVYRIWGRLALAHEEARLERMLAPDDEQKKDDEVMRAVEFFVFSQLIETGDTLAVDAVEKMVEDARAGAKVGDPTSLKILKLVKEMEDADDAGDGAVDGLKN